MRWAAPLAAGLWLGASVSPVFGQAPPTLVGNIGQPTITTASPVFAVQSAAAQFSTGASAERWTLAGIQLEVKNWQSGETPTVSLHGASGQSPGARIATLTNPSAGAGSKIFDAPSGSDIVLQANTTYTVVIESRSFSFNGFSLLNTESAAEDDGGAPGWQIADSRLVGQGGGWSVSTSGSQLKFAVLGTAEAGDATLSALTLTGGDGSAIDLDPSFAADTTSYTAAAAHSASAIAVSATATDAEATLSIASDDDASTPGSAALDLAVGENVVTVTVTAADGVTTETYTVTVTRAAAPPTGPSRVPRALVGNIGQATAESSSPVFALQSVAMQFGTGASANGWTLTSIQLEVRSWDAAVTPTVSLHGASGRSPGARIATLANPSAGTGSKTFAAQAGSDIALQANTTYTLVVESRSFSFSGFSLLNTESAAEDSGGAPGWLLDDTGLTNRGSGWSVSTTSSKPKMAVLGTARAGDATLSALTLGVGGSAIDLDPAFAAGTTSYTAAAAHSVSAVTLSASATDAGATLSIANDDDASTPGTAALDLAVGENIVTVTVTASDGVTAETYTVTVTRAAPPVTGPAPAPQTLVGNFGQRLYGSLDIHKGQRRAGIKFTTGNSATAWNMAAIRLFVTAWHPDATPTVKLRRVSGRWPGSTVATLTNPARSTGLKTFTAPPGLKLQPNTTYAVVAAAGTKVGRFSLGITKSNRQDSGSAAGWSIANASRLHASGGWSSIPQSLMMAVQGAPVAETDGLTGWFAATPDHHDGAASFTFQIGFSDPISMSPNAMRDHAIQLSGGRAVSATRLKRNGNLWDIEIAPTGRAAVSVTVAGGRACASTGAVCTGDGRALADTLALSVPGPLALSVVDDSAREGVDSHVIFAIVLNRAADRLVTVNYATADRTARAGQDYYAESGAMTFTVGTTRTYVSVPVLDDAIDEGDETFAFVLSTASGAVIADAEGTGTIVNDDPIPKAWLVRFGRTVAGQAVDAIAGRLEGGGPHVTIGGQAVSLSGKPKAGGDGGNPLSLAGAAGETRTMTGREALHRSSFRLAAEDRSGGAGWTAWGRFATGGFDADTDDGMRLDGSVVSGFLGADFAAARWLAGVALGLSESEGDFTVAADADRGNVESTLIAAYPYVRLKAGEKVDVWGLVGYGEGELALTLRADANRRQDEKIETDIAMRMGAVGARGQVISPSPANRLALAIRSDAFWVRTESDAVRNSSGNLEGSEADASRLRLLVEGSQAFAMGEGVFTPKLELGLRHDGGDAETGTGIEAGAGLRYSAGSLTAEGSVRTLVAHEDGGYEEWGAAGSLHIDPGASGRGLSLLLTPGWGAAPGGEERLWSLADARGLTQQTGGLASAGRLEAELGYGFGLPGSAGVATPWAGLALGDGVGRIWRGGARWRIASQAMLTLEGARREPANAGAAAEHSMAARFTGRW